MNSEDKARRLWLYVGAGSIAALLLTVAVTGSFNRSPAVVVQTAPLAPVLSPAEQARLEKEAHQRAAVQGGAAGIVNGWHAFRAKQRQKEAEQQER